MGVHPAGAPLKGAERGGCQQLVGEKCGLGVARESRYPYRDQAAQASCACFTGQEQIDMLPYRDLC